MDRVVALAIEPARRLVRHILETCAKVSPAIDSRVDCQPGNARSTEFNRDRDIPLSDTVHDERLPRVRCIRLHFLLMLRLGKGRSG